MGTSKGLILAQPASAIGVALGLRLSYPAMTDSPLRVAIDAHSIGRRATGNETYVRGLASGLASQKNVAPILLVDLGVALPPGLPSVRRLRFRHPVPRLLGELATPARRWAVDLLHVQYVRPPICDVPCVTTIHDISFEHFPVLFTRKSVARMRLTIPWSARHSKVVLTGSEYSRSDLIDRYGLAEETVRTTPYAADARFHPVSQDEVARVARRLGLPSEYVLCVGNLQPRKNLARVLDAYVRLGSMRPPLVIVGQRAWLHDSVFEAVRRNRLHESVYFTGYVESEDLPAVYAGALAFAYPSLFEGFGLPVLEAMATGVPTLSSSTSSIPEVAGDAAILVNPMSVDEIAEGISSLISSSDLRADLRSRGLEQAKRFSWDRCAEMTLAAYASALQR